MRIKSICFYHSVIAWKSIHSLIMSMCIDLHYVRDDIKRAIYLEYYINPIAIRTPMTAV